MSSGDLQVLTSSHHVVTNPRFGLAYDLSGNGMTAVRAGADRLVADVWEPTADCSSSDREGARVGAAMGGLVVDESSGSENVKLRHKNRSGSRG